jgi:mRNA interferase MazF
MLPMTTYQAGDLLLVSFPFVSGGQLKIRPAMVFLDTGDADVVLARITSRPAQSLNEVFLNEWRRAGLVAPSTVRLHKLATLDKNLVHRWLGTIQKPDRQLIGSVLLQMFGNW